MRWPPPRRRNSQTARRCADRRPFPPAPRHVAAEIGGTRSCSLASSSATSSGSRSRRVDSTWPNLTKIGPSLSSARRKRTPRGWSKRRPRVTVHDNARTQRWRNPDRASSSSPNRSTVNTMNTSRRKRLMAGAVACAAGRRVQPARRCADRVPAPSPAGASGRPPSDRAAAPCRPRCPSAGSAAAS